MVRENLHLVQIAAAKMSRTNRHVDLDDLIQDGWFGLRQAARQFDPSRGLKFATYAGQRIWGAMLDAIRLLDFVPRLDRKRGLPTVGLQSLATPMFESDTGRTRALGEFLVDERAAAGVEAFEGRDHFVRLLSDLDRDERLIIELYYAADMTMKEIGRAIGVSESLVSVMHSNLLPRLRARLTPPPNSRKDA